MPTSLPILDVPATPSDIEPLPNLYARWLTEMFGVSIPRETYATCDHCVMCSPSESLHGGRWAFDPDVKCCTLTPELPNYLVGQILTDTSAALAYGRQAIESRIEARLGVTPLGIGMTPSYRIAYEAVGAKIFGRSEALRCPYFDRSGHGTCSIWAYRNSTCATYFCKHVRGAVGSRFWMNLRGLLSVIEAELSLHCALELGCDPSALTLALERRGSAANDSLGAELLSERHRPAPSAGWSGWTGCEIEFYRACAAMVDALRFQDVVNLCGPRVRVSIEHARASHRQTIERRVPQRLQARTVPAHPAHDMSVRIAAYSFTDPIAISKRVFALLPYFDGNTDTEAVLRHIAQHEGVTLDESLLIRLVDHDVLREVAPT